MTLKEIQAIKETYQEIKDDNDDKNEDLAKDEEEADNGNMLLLMRDFDQNLANIKIAFE